MATKAVREAKAALAAAQRTLAAKVAEVKAADAARKKAQEAADKVVAPARKRPVLILRPGENVLIGTLASVRPSDIQYSQEAKDALSLPVKARQQRFFDLFVSGALKVNLASEGVSMTLRGLAAKTRTVDKATLSRLAALDRKASDAERRAREAREAWRAAKRAAHAAGGKVSPEDFASWLARWATISVSVSRGPNAYTGELERAVVAAKAHLDHLEAQSSDPCPCEVCRGQRWNREREVAEAQRQAKRDAEAKAREKAIARAPRVQFTCPACGDESVSPVLDGEVECQEEGCGATLRADAIRTKRVPKSVPVGPAPNMETAA